MKCGYAKFPPCVCVRDAKIMVQVRDLYQHNQNLSALAKGDAHAYCPSESSQPPSTYRVCPVVNLEASDIK